MKWPKEQIESAKEFAERIIDISFPNIDPKLPASAIHTIADHYFLQISRYGLNYVIVMLQGEFSLCYSLFLKLKAYYVPIAVPTTERRVIEETKPDGSIVKKSVFKFVRWRIL